MATIISTKTSGVGGLQVTGDASGVLQLASNNGTTAVTVDASQNVTLNSSGSLSLPAGTTAQRPSSPVNGMFRYNTTTSTWEAYNNGGWNPSNPSIVTNYQQFTTSGTFTVPLGVTIVQVLLVGGGGGGGTVGAGGGGGGGVLLLQNYRVTPLSSITVVVGAGGSAASLGGYSQWDTHQIAFGGGGGPTLTDRSFGAAGGAKLGASGSGAGATSSQVGTPAPGSSQGSAGGYAPTVSPFPAGCFTN